MHNFDEPLYLCSRPNELFSLAPIALATLYDSTASFFNLVSSSASRRRINYLHASTKHFFLEFVKNVRAECKSAVNLSSLYNGGLESDLYAFPSEVYIISVSQQRLILPQM